MHAFRRLSGTVPPPEEDWSSSQPTSRRHRHLHHHHHKDYAVSPMGGNRPITIPPENEEPRRHRHRHRRQRSGSPERPAVVIDPEPGSSSSSGGGGGSVVGVKIPTSSNGTERRRRRAKTTASDQTPPLTPIIKTTPPTPSPLEQARRSNTHPVVPSSARKAPLPYPDDPLANEYTLELSRDPEDLFSDLGDHRSKRYSAPVAQKYKDQAPRADAVEIGSSDSITQPPRRSNTTAAKARTRTAAAPAFARSRGSVKENSYDFLNAFDTVFVIDDSGSMSERDYWSQLRIALESLVSVAGKYDADGIDIHFLNASEHDRTNITDTKQVSQVFEKVQPQGVTPTGACLDRILRSYLDKYSAVKAAYAQSSPLPGSDPSQPTLYSLLPKPLNIIVLTDGEPTDDPESVIVAAARALDRLNAPLHQVGIQFVQIGNEDGAREVLEELDDRLEEIYGVRDMVDFTPFAPGGEPGAGVTGEVILKALVGAVNRRYDRWRNP